MEKRVFLAVVLSFAVLYGYQALFLKKPVPGAASTQSTPNANAASPVSTSGGSVAAPATTELPSGTVPSGLNGPLPASTLADSAARPIEIDSDTVRATFNTRGAVLTSWKLKHYLDDQRQPVDLVASTPPAGAPLAFAIGVQDAALTERLSQALFRPSAASVQWTGTSAPAPLVFEFEDAEGLQARKVFSFVQAAGGGASPYVVRLEASVSVNGVPQAVVVHSGAGVGNGLVSGMGSSSFLAPSYVQRTEGIAFRDGKVTRTAAASLLPTPSQGAFGYVGIDDHYFLQVLLPGAKDLNVSYRAFGTAGNAATPQQVAYSASFAPGAVDAHYFLGPKDFDVLASVQRDMVRAINYGMFDVIVVPLLRALKWVNGFVSNYGWSIILLTILINAAMFPLRHKSVVSMRKLQLIQPQIQEIQARYADLKMTDPKRQNMNQEMMQLYRDRGVNPASGCVPMLLTMPVLFAFYSMLSQSIELRGAPFMGWIQDLSKHDPSYITPLLMGATMLWQQKITPSTADPVQQKVMLFMPVMFTFMFLWAPSGLVIYWFVSNVWSIGQQYLTSYLIGAPPTPPARAGRAKAAASA